MSKKGKLDLIKRPIYENFQYLVGYEYETLTEGETPESLGFKSELQDVFENGNIFVDEEFNSIKERAKLV